MLASPSIHRRATHYPLPVLYFGFVLTGMVTTLLGPLLPGLTAELAMTDAQAGSLFAAQFLASTVGAVFATRSYRFSLPFGFALMSAGTVALSDPTWNTVHAAVICCGLGFGFAIPATNLIVAESSTEHSGSALNLLNLAWGLGAILFPLTIHNRPDPRITLTLLSATLFLSFVYLLWLSLTTTAIEHSSHQSSTEAADSDIYALVLFAILFFLYVGVESSIGGWTTLYAARVGDRNSTHYETLAVACFWGSLLSGRAVAAIVLRWVPEKALLHSGLSLASAGVVSLVFAHSGWQVAVATTITGAGLAPVFALNVSLLAKSAQSTRNSGWIFAFSGVGGALLPWATGFISSRTGSMRAGLLTPALAMILLLVLTRFMLPLFVKTHARAAHEDSLAATLEL